MTTNNMTAKDVFSLRIVVADYYMCKPYANLDICYSDFRAHEIRSVPIIRIFGADKNGEKTCLHVHGVFPYFYIPYKSTNFENINSAVYQMAAAIDKAVNISLGQGTSQQQHVFKIQLVKGMPFYGYHQNEHQFLKIFLYNPRFIKRVANLFQNGVILEKVFQPHEAHVPYILQFFIDYNLYGMSFLHMPKDIVKYRITNDEAILKNININQVLRNVPQISISRQEIDVAATFILNRFQLLSKSMHTNPGIEAIWQDEISRRKNLLNEKNDVPELKLHTSQERTKVKSSESNIFYLAALKRRLEQFDSDSSQCDSIVSKTITEKKRKFSVNKLLMNAIYPQECSEADRLLDASLIQDHFSGESPLNVTTIVSSGSSMSNSSVSTDILNEDLVMTLSQSELNQTLQEKDWDLLKIIENLEQCAQDDEILEVMRKLEENEEVDLDSTLAPLSQNPKIDSVIRKDKDGNKSILATLDSSDSEDGDLNDYTLIVDNEEEIFNNTTEKNSNSVSECLPQLDGADNCISNSNNINKTPIRRSGRKTLTTPTKRPRRYNQLEITTTKSPKSTKRKSDGQQKSECKESKTKQIKSASKSTPKYAMHIETRGSLKNLKKCESGKDASVGVKICGEEGMINTIKPDSMQRKTLGVAYPAIKFKKCRVKLKRLNIDQKYTSIEKSKNEKRAHSPSDVAREHDRKNNFYPEPGPSRINEYEQIDEPNPVPDHTTADLSPISINSNESDTDNFLNVRSFYDNSLFLESPSIFSEYSSKSSRKNEKTAIINDIQTSKEEGIIITPKELPPDPQEVSKHFIEYNIPDVTYQTPFYSKMSDITEKKEVGSTVLKIPSNSLQDCEEFQSVVPNLQGLYAVRKKMLSVMGNLSDKLKSHSEIKEFLCNHSNVVITPLNLPPSKSDAILWLKNQKISHGEEDLQQDINIEDDSPIKVRKEKAKTVLESESVLETDVPGSDDVCSTTTISSKDLSSAKVKATLGSLKMSFTKSQSLSRARLSLSQKFDEMTSLHGFKSSSQEIMKEDSHREDSIAQNLQVPLQLNKLNSNINNDPGLMGLERSTFRKISNVDSNRSSCEDSFGISGASLENTFGFKFNLDNLQNAKADLEFDYLTIMAVEIFVPTRGHLKPNPQYDPIHGVFYAIVNNVPSDSVIPKKLSGCILVRDVNDVAYFKADAKMHNARDELHLLKQLSELSAIWDPDILLGYEIEMNSWGYIMDRYRYLNMCFPSLFSRIPSQKNNFYKEEEKDQDGTDLDMEMKLCGRILLDVWRLMRSEIALTSYTFENVVYHILHKRCPLHSFYDLTMWSKSAKTLWIVLDYYFERVNGTLELLEQLDLIGRTSEMAKLIGIQFYEVLSRGSQFRVESMMLRIAKPKNVIPLSPSVKQRAHMRAPEYLPLILEPESRFYVDPLIVLDFQSLYPSVIIAYNYCFSTCLGRVEHLGQYSPFEFGASQLRVSPFLIKQLILKDDVTVSPCGVAFVKANIRQGILPKMLQEILDTRLMVKQSMKVHKSNSTLQRVLHSRQLGLKLMANVTYGYTAANFSGRMPCVEVGDSVVAKGRETLERAIKLVNENKNWRARVVYGDTDSLFVLVPGRSREDAFRIGEEIVEKVTNENPQPIKLKLEKVYHPCILQTKKRYVGYMYESSEQKTPVYEAKGIETVRRDGCPAVAKMLEKCLRILFETRDVSKVKSYVCRQFTKILSGKANVQDLIFAKEFRGKNGYKPGACVPALELTKKWLSSDPRSEPRRGERVPFIIVNGPPGVPLIRLVRSPHEYFSNEGMKINATYYITKAIIPPLNRCFLLIGANMHDWFADLPRKSIFIPKFSTSKEIAINNLKKSTISQYFSSMDCVCDCGRQTKTGICSTCIKNPKKCVVKLCYKTSTIERKYVLTQKICESCCGRSFAIKCQSLDCPVLFVLEMKKREHSQNEHFRQLLTENF